MTATTFYNSQPVDDYISELSLREKEVTRSRRIDNFKKEVPYKILLFLGYVLGVCLLILCLFYGLRNMLIKKGYIYDAPQITTRADETYRLSPSIDEDQIIDIEGIINANGKFNNSALKNSTDKPTKNKDPVKTRDKSTNTNHSPILSGAITQGSSNAPIVSDSIETPIQNPGFNQGSGNLTTQAIADDSANGCECNTEQQVVQTSNSNPSIQKSSCETSLENEQPNEIEKMKNIDVPKKGTVRDYVIFDFVPVDSQYISQITVGRGYDEPGGEVKRIWCYTQLNYKSGISKTLYLVRSASGKTDITEDVAREFGVSIEEIVEAQARCQI